MRRAGVALAATILLSGVLAATAPAHTVKHEGTLTAKLKKGGKEAGSFYGALDSTSGRCEVDREVRVKLATEGGPDTTVGGGFTDPAGDWEVTAPADLTPGDYYAKAPKLVLKKNKKHRHVCRRAVSDPITVK